MMLFVVDDIEFNIVLDDLNKEIRIIKSKQGTIQLSVPAQTPKAELELFIRTHKKLIAQEADGPTPEITDFRIFDKLYAVKINPVLINPFIEKNVVNLPRYPKSSRESDALSTVLLSQVVCHQVGLWEERLNVLFGDIIFRKLKTNYYTVCTNRKKITLNTSLIQKPLAFVDYMVAEAVLKTLSIRDSQKLQLMETFIADFKRIERIVTYERYNQ